MDLVEQSPRTVAALGSQDAYELMALLGKKVVHPGGKPSTDALFRMAGIQAHDRVLEIGCGPGTTSIEIARRTGARVMATDIDVAMLDRARSAIAEAGMESTVSLEAQDIEHLTYPDDSFDVVIIEAVTMFVDPVKATREAVRVCRPGGTVIDHEFIWKREPPEDIRHTFQVDVCAMDFETDDKWQRLYRDAGLTDIEATLGDFDMMSIRGFLRDEGFANSCRMALRAVSRRIYIRRGLWNIRRILPAAPYLGWVVLRGTKDAGQTAAPRSTD